MRRVAVLLLICLLSACKPPEPVPYGGAARSSSQDISLEIFEVPSTFTYDEAELSRIAAIERPRDDLLTDMVLAWDGIAMEVVRREGFPPTKAAALYAALTVGQAELIALNEEFNGVTAAAFHRLSSEIVCSFSPAQCKAIVPPGGDDAFSRDASALVLAKLTERTAREKAGLVLPIRPIGEGLWNGETPVTPDSGSWLHWLPSPAPRDESRRFLLTKHFLNTLLQIIFDKA